MRERVEQMGGKLMIASSRGKGTWNEDVKAQQP
jgi:signal transduction histidine kinase